VAQRLLAVLNGQTEGEDYGVATVQQTGMSIIGFALKSCNKNES
jgi:hypothetical protein